MFTGYDYGRSIFEDSYNPLIDMAEIMPYNETSLLKSMFFIGRKNLIKTFVKRIFLGQNRHDINPSRQCEDIDILKRHHNKTEE